MTRQQTAQCALDTLVTAGFHTADAQRMLDVLRNAGLGLANDRDNELVCRWVDVQERAVPPEADTIIRTITTSVDDRSWSTTHWLDGLRGPQR